MHPHPSIVRPLRLLLLLAGTALSLVAAPPVIHTEVDVHPQPMRTPPPVYPSEMKSQGVTGMVVLDVVIDDQGKVAEAAVVKSTGEAFNSPSVEAVRQWVFKPARKDGNAVWVRLRLPVKFS